MKRILNYAISEKENGQTILTFLKTYGYSHQVLLHLKRTPDGICRNGLWARVSDTLHTFDRLTIFLAEESSSANIVATKLPFPIVYEDDDLLIINKPAGMPIHPSQGNYDNTLANAAAYYFTTRVDNYVYRCINRLDRDTSGLLILAKHMYCASLLSTAMSTRDIHREYLAVATGDVPFQGTIQVPIGRVPGSTIERFVDETNGDSACTHFRKLYYKNGYSLVSLQLDTGRTHQIRVHMKHLGHPLPGDFLYNPDYTVIKRQALHSFRLTFTHPITGQVLTFKEQLPEDMRNIFIH